MTNPDMPPAVALLFAVAALATITTTGAILHDALHYITEKSLQRIDKKRERHDA